MKKHNLKKLLSLACAAAMALSLAACAPTGEKSPSSAVPSGGEKKVTIGIIQ